MSAALRVGVVEDGAEGGGGRAHTTNTRLGQGPGAWAAAQHAQHAQRDSTVRQPHVGAHTTVHKRGGSVTGAAAAAVEAPRLLAAARAAGVCVRA